MDSYIKNNKITATLVVLSIVVGIFYYHTNEISLETAKIEKNTLSDIDSQTKCAAQSKLFLDYYAPDSSKKGNFEYSNHYNSRAKKCFVLLTTYDSTDSTSHLVTKDFFDAIEKTQYASLGKLNFVLSYCSIGTDQMRKDKPMVCKSEDEFDAFVNSYMQD